MMATDFGNRLKAARKHAGLTQTAFAKKVGISQSTVGELEKIGHGSSFSHKMAVVCGVDPHWLAAGEGEMVQQRQAAHRVESGGTAYMAIPAILEFLGATLAQHSETRRRSCADMLARFAIDPSNAELREELDLLLSTAPTVNQKRRA